MAVGKSAGWARVTVGVDFASGTGVPRGSLRDPPRTGDAPSLGIGLALAFAGVGEASRGEVVAERVGSGDPLRVGDGSGTGDGEIAWLDVVSGDQIPNFSTPTALEGAPRSAGG